MDTQNPSADTPRLVTWNPHLREWEVSSGGEKPVPASAIRALSARVQAGYRWLYDNGYSPDVIDWTSLDMASMSYCVLGQLARYHEYRSTGLALFDTFLAEAKKSYEWAKSHGFALTEGDATTVTYALLDDLWRGILASDDAIAGENTREHMWRGATYFDGETE